MCRPCVARSRRSGLLLIPARMLAVSVRSLQRQLQIEGTPFECVLAETRESLARRYLDRGRRSNDEVAFLLGDGDVRSFVRAFVARTGTTPGQLRRRSVAGSHDAKETNVYRYDL